MTRIMLDTNAASTVIRQSSPALYKRFRRTPIQRLCISAITEGEMRYGLARKPEDRSLKIRVEGFLMQVKVLPWHSEAAESYGALRVALAIAGTPLSDMDTLIAAHALSVGATLVTNDKAFRHVKRLKTVDWMKA
jgi:tRNA(fMet)-specific endonuclease VapC